MGNIYKVKVNDTFTFDFTKEEILKTDSTKNLDSSYHLLQDHQSYHTEILDSDFISKNYTIKVNNNTYHVSIDNALDMQIKEMGFSIGSSKQVDAIKAPMPGLLLDIQIDEGQEVKENDPLLILEAMKMENVILSPRDGIIKSISASKGEAVDKGQLLVEFES
ncbi:acetyl-CoA carboxylase biotin carboxyl carrier protein subunit [Aquimarina algicola]|uniref:Acetyl-CoA carboxylase biotin carboxyl carrier protein subunit n=1 Tax=Aquimarina algicola TaxID=2589995 RepID=A0A504J0Y2_9FLAO|nr:acetyl-CoA carboxylase biotin carboxyl carrier protein subunit [Aquimarina algicola]TPN82265.1 acetyl-CoA carboxylase biotin carboxyl carrier protein subunit [Aquimarina algicola]